MSYGLVYEKERLSGLPSPARDTSGPKFIRKLKPSRESEITLDAYYEVVEGNLENETQTILLCIFWMGKGHKVFRIKRISHVNYETVGVVDFTRVKNIETYGHEILKVHAEKDYKWRFSDPLQRNLFLGRLGKCSSPKQCITERVVDSTEENISGNNDNREDEGDEEVSYSNTEESTTNNPKPYIEDAIKLHEFIDKYKILMDSQMEEVNKVKNVDVVPIKNAIMAVRDAINSFLPKIVDDLRVYKDLSEDVNDLRMNFKVLETTKNNSAALEALLDDLFGHLSTPLMSCDVLNNLDIKNPDDVDKLAEAMHDLRNIKDLPGINANLKNFFAVKEFEKIGVDRVSSTLNSFNSYITSVVELQKSNNPEIFSVDNKILLYKYKPLLLMLGEIYPDRILEIGSRYCMSVKFLYVHKIECITSDSSSSIPITIDASDGKCNSCPQDKEKCNSSTSGRGIIRAVKNIRKNSISSSRRLSSMGKSEFDYKYQMILIIFSTIKAIISEELFVTKFFLFSNADSDFDEVSDYLRRLEVIQLDTVDVCAITLEIQKHFDKETFAKSEKMLKNIFTPVVSLVCDFVRDYLSSSPENYAMGIVANCRLQRIMNSVNESSYLRHVIQELVLYIQHYMNEKMDIFYIGDIDNILAKAKFGILEDVKTLYKNFDTLSENILDIFERKNTLVERYLDYSLTKATYIVSALVKKDPQLESTFEKKSNKAASISYILNSMAVRNIFGTLKCTFPEYYRKASEIYLAAMSNFMKRLKIKAFGSAILHINMADAECYTTNVFKKPAFANSNSPRFSRSLLNNLLKSVGKVIHMFEFGAIDLKAEIFLEIASFLSETTTKLNIHSKNKIPLISTSEIVDILNDSLNS